MVQLHAEDMVCMVFLKVVHRFFELDMMVQGDKVKKGQTVAYIEQLGTFVPVEVRTHLLSSLLHPDPALLWTAPVYSCTLLVLA